MEADCWLLLGWLGIVARPVGAAGGKVSRRVRLISPEEILRSSKVWVPKVMVRARWAV